MLSGVFVRFFRVSILPMGMSCSVFTCLSSSRIVDGCVLSFVLRVIVLVKLMLPSVLMCGVVGCFSVSIPVRLSSSVEFFFSSSA